MKPTLLIALFCALITAPASAVDPHVETVTRIVEAAKGKIEKTEDGQSLKLVDLAVPGAGPHDHRKDDPYDAAFFEHLGHITTLESLNVIATKANDEWIKPLAKLTNLKTLRFTNNGKLTDAGMEHFAGLKNLETFSFVGTGITGKAYAKCTGWTKVTRVSHRGSSIDDEGLQQLCEHLPNLESISLAHAKFTDVGAPHLAKLTKLKGLELGTNNATPQTLTHLAKLPLEYLQLGEGFDTPESIPLIKGLATLRRLTLTNAKAFTDADLRVVASLRQLEQLELGKIDLPDERLAVLKDFAFLKSMRLVPVKEPFTLETQAKIKALLPKVALTFR
ncbi:MAG: G protein-coupled receptor LGR4 [Chthoniobacteraceae bacterium]